MCDDSEKEEKLNALLKTIASDRNNKIIVFVETKKKVDDIAKAIKREGMFNKYFLIYFQLYF